MKWLINLLKKIFCKEKIKLIDVPKNINAINETENNTIKDSKEFIRNLKIATNPEICDGNGYGIKKAYNAEDMI